MGRCRYCEKEFRRESSLASHMCEPKRRWQQEKQSWVQLGLQAYLRFFEVTQGSARNKSYQDFVASPYYTAFVKFGSYCQQIRCVSFRHFLDWLLKNNRRLDSWCSDRLYTEWLPTYLQCEAPQDALERALEEMQAYADGHPELRGGWTEYFRYGNSNRICHHITTGRISAWVVYNCETGLEFLDNLSVEQVSMVIQWIDPTFWNKKFQDYPADALWVKDILKQAGL